MATDVQHTSGPTRVDVLPALRRHWFVALAPVVLFVAAAVAVGVKRPVTYTAKANLSVGHVYVNNPVGISTVYEASKALAAAYSRAIRSDAVTAETRRRLASSGRHVSGQVSATPMPDSPLISVSAESSSSGGAVALANAAGAALAAYVNRQIRDNQASTLLAARYRAAALRYRQLSDVSRRASRAYETGPTAKRKARRDRAAAAADTALLRRNAVRASYEAAVEGGSASVGVEVFSKASAATNDRRRVLQLLVFVGLIGGLAAGTALALLRVSRQVRRYRDR